MKKIFRALVALVALLSACSLSLAGTLEGKIVNVADGDTVTILTDDRQQVKVRLYGIDCPERRQAFGGRATDYTRKALAGRRVSVEAIDRDRYGRTVGIVQEEGRESINEQLLKAGLAWVYVRYCKIPKCRQWRQLEENARTNRKGLWKDSSPVPPWLWRRETKR